MEFREIDRSNYWDCISLTVDDSQKWFVAAFLDYFKKKHNAEKLYISVSLDNAVVRGMYADIGFEEIKEVAYSFSGRQVREMQMVKKL